MHKNKRRKRKKYYKDMEKYSNYITNSTSSKMNKNKITTNKAKVNKNIRWDDKFLLFISQLKEFYSFSYIYTSLTH